MSWIVVNCKKKVMLVSPKRSVVWLSRWEPEIVRIANLASK